MNSFYIGDGDIFILTYSTTNSHLDLNAQINFSNEVNIFIGDSNFDNILNISYIILMIDFILNKINLLTR